MLAQISFTERLVHEIDSFRQRDSLHSVLVFPPLLPKYRYLFHELIARDFGHTFGTVSIGTEGNRRPLLYYKSAIDCKEMDSNDDNIVKDVPQVKSEVKHKTNHKKGKRFNKDNDGRNRRPDMKLYVPPKAKNDTNCSETQTCSQDIAQDMCQTVDGLTRLDITDSSHEKRDNCDTHCCDTNTSNSSPVDCIENNSFDTKNCSEEVSEDLTPLKATNDVSVEESWDSLFDDNGECVQQEFADNVNGLIGSEKLKLEKCRIDYMNFQYNEPEIDGSEFAHVLEVYDFSTELKTQDIMTSISVFNSRDFDIKWVDDTHALVVFSNSNSAKEALKYVYPNIKLRPLSQAIRDSKVKARKSSEFLQPFKQRPQTSASLARRLVTQSLGLRDRITPEQRAAERKKLADAKEKRRLATKQVQDVWEGNVS
ncbi:unnamed protein product [Medioppia subpectinata]|uniref:R3H domain-containing protein n=1 Tax=Medioppia subpectinata TaxID=1979941 RepID=A0A7R9KHX3_9ACAR|nr:unnamed protein product [Medioppia subpectinata]CAG2102641.1 unnamed protein product [Medioppia subpectinata]